MIAQDEDKNICISNPHLLNAFFIHTHLWENLFKDFAQDKGKEADGSHAQSVAHFLQDLPGFLSEGIGRREGLPGELKGRQSRVNSEKQKPELLSLKPMWLIPMGPMTNSEDSVCFWLDLTQLTHTVDKWCSIILFPVLGKVSHKAQAGLELIILPPPPTDCQDQRGTPLCSMKNDSI